MRTMRQLVAASPYLLHVIASAHLSQNPLTCVSRVGIIGKSQLGPGYASV